MTDLGTFGGSHSEAYGINGSGEVVGSFLTADSHVRPFAWRSGVASELPTLGDVSEARGINAGG